MRDIPSEEFQSKYNLELTKCNRRVIQLAIEYFQEKAALRGILLGKDDRYILSYNKISSVSKPTAIRFAKYLFALKKGDRENGKEAYLEVISHNLGRDDRKAMDILGEELHEY